MQTFVAIVCQTRRTRDDDKFRQLATLTRNVNTFGSVCLRQRDVLMSNSKGLFAIFVTKLTRFKNLILYAICDPDFILAVVLSAAHLFLRKLIAQNRVKCVCHSLVKNEWNNGFNILVVLSKFWLVTRCPFLLREIRRKRSTALANFPQNVILSVHADVITRGAVRPASESRREMSLEQ